MEKQDQAIQAEVKQKLEEVNANAKLLTKIDVERFFKRVTWLWSS
jgi:hypothetical protein